MAGLKEQEKWEEEVYQIEENDPVHGGENGVTNKPAKQLANRTKWLKKKVETRATTEQEGMALLTEALDSDATDLGLAAKAGKRLKDLIDALTRNLGNYIPNSKKSDAVNSPSSDTVATSAAVKRAYDNADARINRDGDAMRGALRGKSGTLSQNNPHNVGFVFDGDTDTGMANPQDGVLQLIANGEVVFDGNAPGKTTRLRNVLGYMMDLQSDGNLAVRNGDQVLWHAFDMLTKGEFYHFRNKFTHDTYSGNNSSSFVFRIPLSANLGIKVYLSQIVIGENLSGMRFTLGEAFSGFRVAFATAADGHRRSMGAEMSSDTQVIIHCETIPVKQTVNLAVFGFYQY